VVPEAEFPGDAGAWNAIMELDATFFALAVPAVLFAGVSKGGFGSGAAFAASPLLALVLDPALAVALMLPLLMLMDVAGLRSYWGGWAAPQARALMIGAVPGVIAGMLLFRSVSPDALRLLLGGLALGFVAWEIARARGLIEPPPARPAAGLAWGGLCGFTSFVSHAGGPPAAIYLLGSRLEKTAYQASTVLVFWWVNLIKLPAYIALGLFTAETLHANVLLAPVAIAGVLIGVWAHRRIPARPFFLVTYALLTVTGTKLIWDALA
jgi:uncharacterized protein